MPTIAEAPPLENLKSQYTNTDTFLTMMIFSQAQYLNMFEIARSIERKNAIKEKRKPNVNNIIDI